MNQSEAKQKIDEIHQLFYAGHTIVGSPKALLLSGIVCLTAALVLGLERLSATHLLEARATSGACLLIWVGLATLARRSRKQLSEERQTMTSQHETLHPLILQSFGAGRAILAAGVGLTIVWWPHTDRLLVLWMVLFGIVTRLWGQFIHRQIGIVSYGVIAGAIALASLVELNMTTEALTPLALAYCGAWTVILSVILKKHQRS